jgi:hypothetical protein
MSPFRRASWVAFVGANLGIGCGAGAGDGGTGGSGVATSSASVNATSGLASAGGSTSSASPNATSGVPSGGGSTSSASVNGAVVDPNAFGGAGTRHTVSTTVGAGGPSEVPATGGRSEPPNGGGGAGTGGSGGGTGAAEPMPCSVPFIDGFECLDCMRAVCCNEYAAFLEAGGAEWGQCRQACDWNAEDCLEGCDAAFPRVEAAVNAFYECDSSDECDGICNQADGEVTVCDQWLPGSFWCKKCLGDNCCPALDACVGSEECTDCMFSPPEECTSGGEALFQEWLTCLDASCQGECQYMQLPICDSGLLHLNALCAECLSKACCGEATTCDAEPSCVDCMGGDDDACARGGQSSATNLRDCTIAHCAGCEVMPAL